MKQILPPRADRFEIRGWTADEGSSTLFAHFYCSRFGSFTETVRIPAEPAAFKTLVNGPGRGLCDLLTIALGVSYYKAAAAKEIALPALSADGHAMATALYTEGLAEFFVRAQLVYPAEITFTGNVSGQISAAPITIQPGPAIVAFGGGKDSYVARAIVRQAGHPVSLASVTLSDAVQSVLRATSPDPIAFLSRQLDPKLGTATKDGFNGHVPITAINMLMLCLHAQLVGAVQVIFANERSADEPTIHLDNGISANHQYSKSSAFETLLQRAIRTETPDAPLPYSILRPFSELWIGKAFSRLNYAFDRFTSCNRNFRIAGDANKRWCGACAKCAFTSLLLSPHISTQEGLQIFGDVFLDRDALQPLYQELLGLSAHKPWDCVGTIDESRAALFAASKTSAWRETKAISTMMQPVLTHAPKEHLAEAWTRGLEMNPINIVPDAYLNAARELER